MVLQLSMCELGESDSLCFRIFPRGISHAVDATDYRAICLFSACLLYAFFGSPTPNTMGIGLILTGAMLALSVGAGRGRDALIVDGHAKFWKGAGWLFLVYGMTMPVIVSALHGHSVFGMGRDILPFLFLFLPLFLLPQIRMKPEYFRTSLVAIIVIGLIFSMRSLLMRNPDLCSVWCTEELLYLENMPTVLFGALFLLGAAFRHLMMQGVTQRSVVIFSVLFVLALFPVAAMVVTVQRASLGAIALYILLLGCFFFRHAPARATAVTIVGGLAFLIIGISFGHVLYMLTSKTALVGLNMRPQEFEAVWAVVSADLFTFLFGIGWGGQFYSPAVGGLSVNFTHNFFTSILLKTGICGLVLAVLYIMGLLERLGRVVLRDPVLGLALALPILIDLTLYASFKSLDFGLVLLMIPASLVYLRQSESLISPVRMADA